MNPICCIYVYTKNQKFVLLKICHQVSKYKYLGSRIFRTGSAMWTVIVIVCSNCKYSSSISWESVYVISHKCRSADYIHILLFGVMYVVYDDFMMDPRKE